MKLNIKNCLIIIYIQLTKDGQLFLKYFIIRDLDYNIYYATNRCVNVNKISQRTS